MRIKKIEIQGFRGFVNNTIFEFEESEMVLIYGPNGHGKTSFFDAIEWGLTGKINRYDISSDERNRTKFIRNQLSKNPPIIKLSIVHNDTEILIVREGIQSSQNSTDYGKHTLKLFINNEEYQGEIPEEEYLAKQIINDDWHDKISTDKLNNMYNLTHYLGQEKMLNFVNETKDKDRYDALSTILGTEQFYFYESKFKAARDMVNSDISEIQSDISKLKFEKESVNKEINSLKVELNKQSIDKTEIEQLLITYEQRFKTKLNINSNIDESIKSINMMNKEVLEKGNKLSVKLNQLNLIYNNYKNLNKNYSDNKGVVDNLNNYNKIAVLISEIDEMEYLVKSVKDLTEDQLKLINLQDNIRQLNIDIKHIQQQYNDYQEMYNTILRLFEECKIEKSYDNLIAFVHNQILNKNFKEKLISCLDTINKLFKETEKANRDKEKEEQILKDNEVIINELSSVNDKFQKLLIIVKDYLVDNEDINECPVCGSKNITATHIMNYLEEIKETDFINISNAVNQKNKITKNIEGIHKNIEFFNVQLEEQFVLFKDYMNRYSGQLKIYQEEITALYTKRINLETEINNLNKIFESIKQTLLKYNLTINDNPEILLEKINKYLTLKKLEKNDLLVIVNVKDEKKIFDFIEKAKNYMTDIETKTDNINQLINNYNEAYSENIVYQEIKDVETIIKDHIDNLNNELEENSYNQKFLPDLLVKVNAINTYKRLTTKLSEESILEEKIKNHNEMVKELNRNIVILNEIINNVPNTIDKLNAAAIDELFSLVQQIYSKINSHPLYKKIEVQRDKRYNAYKLIFNVITEENIRSNPSYIYSSAQMRALALSLFLAMAIEQKWTSLDFLCMDDPIQSMDDLNMMAFIDLLRAMAFRDGLMKQFFVSTHNSIFYEMIKKKFKMFNISVIHYHSYDENGPTFFNERNEVQNKPVLIKFPALNETEVKLKIEECLVTS
ncbi:SMC family ATPase [Bacillus cereus group sp. BcHK104]|uniref:SMC family ATPase n=1 Tax=Bacillus cereus group sp. BcHK104 TaxID=3018097 RepID=UPI0022E037AE|nr:SMC family ATPase [Bacillus cereus group sp. BcHK104]MDA1987131.1 SMC family ATPase [Bacillus cereus group sp. BcHK104]